MNGGSQVLDEDKLAISNGDKWNGQWWDGPQNI